MISQTCPNCLGRGKIISKPCKACRGSARTKAKSSIEVQVPAGVDTGVRLRISQEGELPEMGGHRGDLYVEIEVEADDVFERDGVDLFARVHIPFTTAVLGGEIEAPLIEGSTQIKVPKGMQSPHRATLRGEGVKDLRRNRRGDLVIEMHIETPEHLSNEAKEIIQKLDEVLKADQKKKSAGDHHSKKKEKKKGIFSF